MSATQKEKLKKAYLHPYEVYEQKQIAMKFNAEFKKEMDLQKKSTFLDNMEELERKSMFKRLSVRGMSVRNQRGLSLKKTRT